MTCVSRKEFLASQLKSNRHMIAALLALRWVISGDDVSR